MECSLGISDILEEVSSLPHSSKSWRVVISQNDFCPQGQRLVQLGLASYCHLLGGGQGGHQTPQNCLPEKAQCRG